MIDTALSLLLCEALRGVSGEVIVCVVDLKGDCFVDEALGGFSTTFPWEL